MHWGEGLFDRDGLLGRGGLFEALRYVYQMIYTIYYTSYPFPFFEQDYYYIKKMVSVYFTKIGVKASFPPE